MKWVTAAEANGPGTPGVPSVPPGPNVPFVSPARLTEELVAGKLSNGGTMPPNASELGVAKANSGVKG